MRLALGDPFEVEVVKRIFELRITGFGYRAIANQLNKENVACPRRGRWRNLNQRWSMGTIRSIIGNPAYRGAMAYNRCPMTNKRIGEVNILGKQKLKRRSSESDMVLVEGAHEGIVTKEIWGKANRVQQQYSQVCNHRYRESPYLLSGIMKCSRCGFNFQGETHTTRYKNPNWAPSKTLYHNDGGYHAKGLAVCAPLRIRKELIETFVVHSIKEYLAKSNIATRALQQLEEILEADTARVSERERVSVGLTDNTRKMNNLINLVEAGAKVDSVVQLIRELERERDVLQEHLRVIDNSMPTQADLRVMADEIARIVINFQTEFFNSSPSEQKQLIRRFVAAVVIYREEKPRAQCHIRKIPLINASAGSSLECVAGEGLEPSAFGL